MRLNVAGDGPGIEEEPRERLGSTLARPRNMRGPSSGGGLQDRIDRLLETIGRPREFLDRILIRSRRRIFFIKTEEIEWLESAANNIEIRAGGASHLLRETLASLERKPDPRRFARAHRSRVVNLDKVLEIQPWTNGDFVIIVKSGARVGMSRQFRKNLGWESPDRSGRESPEDRAVRGALHRVIARKKQGQVRSLAELRTSRQVFAPALGKYNGRWAPRATAQLSALQYLA